MSDLRDIATLCKEIDYLTTQVDTLRKERDNMGDWIELTKLCKELDDRTTQVETLHKERDEARRDLCERMTVDFNAANQGGVVSLTTKPEWVAKDHGWDCYEGADAIVK